MPLRPHRISCRLFQLQYAISGITQAFLKFLKVKFVKSLRQTFFTPAHIRLNFHLTTSTLLQKLRLFVNVHHNVCKL